MAKQFVPVTGSVLRWAREEIGLSLAELADALKVDRDELAAWEAGAAQPTRGQFSNLVQRLKRPSAVFFLAEPPASAGLPTALRNAPGLGTHSLGPAEVKQIRWARRLQEVLSWVLEDAGEAPVTLESVDLDDSPTQVADDARIRSGITPAEQLGWGSPSEAFRMWRGSLEDRGVLVLQLSMGKRNLRGFSAWNDYAPVVAGNTSYHPTARVFTLLHEYAHLLTRTDAACLQFIVPTEHDGRVERWCEQFAAAFLLPADALREVASRYGASTVAPVTDPDIARRIANRFHVSTRATSIRLQELGIAPTTLYGSVVQHFASKDWNEGGGGGGGQQAPEKRLGQLGTRVPELLLDAAAAGRLNRRDLSDYLELTTGQVDDLAALVEQGR